MISSWQLGYRVKCKDCGYMKTEEPDFWLTLPDSETPDLKTPDVADCPDCPYCNKKCEYSNYIRRVR